MTKRKYTVEYFTYKGVTYASNNMGPYLAARHGDKINYGNKVTKTESRSRSTVPFIPFAPTLVKRLKRNSINAKPLLPPLPIVSNGQKETGKVENNSGPTKISNTNPTTPITPPPYLKSHS